jgi:hypothetical protein
VVKQHGVDALQPLGALINQRLSQPHLGAQIKDVRRPDPALRQALVHQQLTKQPGVELVGLRTPLAILTQPRLGRLSQPHIDAGADAFLGDEAPAGHRLDRDDSRLARQSRQERAHGPAIGRRIRPVRTSPLSVSSTSKVIWARCTSNPTKIAMRPPSA